MSSPLFNAASRGFADTVRKLIENVNDVNIVDELGCTPLCLAAREGHSEVVRILLQHKNIVPSIRDNKNRSPMDAAVINGKAQVLQVLLSNDAIMTEAVKNKTGLLCLAARSNHVEPLKVLLDQLGATVNTQDNKGDSLLAIAAYMGKIDIVQFLLQDPDIDVNLRDTVGRCPLSHAVCSGYCGAKLDLSDREVEAHSKVVQAMISHSDIDMNSKDDQGYTPLSLAVDSGRWEMVEPILAHTKTKVGTGDDSEQIISLGTLINIMNPDNDFVYGETRARYINKAFQYFVEKRNFLVDWMQEDASATLLNFIEHERDAHPYLEAILQQFPLNEPGHDRLFNSLVAILLRKRDESAIKIIFKYSTLVPNLSSDEWLSRIETGIQQTDTDSMWSCFSVLSILIDKDTGFPRFKNEKMDKVIGNMLLCAASSAHGDCIFKSLSERQNIDFNYRDHNNCTALWYAADNARLDNMEQLLRIDDIEVHHEDNTDHETAVLRLLKVRNDIAYPVDLTRAEDLSDFLLLRNTIPKNGMMLIQAATLGQQDTVRSLLGCTNIDLNHRGDNDETPLICASHNGHKEVVRMLLSDSRVIPTLEDKFHHSALHAAVVSNHVDVALLFSERDNITWTRFCNNGLVDELMFLVKIKLPLHTRDLRGRTPLHLACLNGDVRMIQELVKAGTDLNLDDNYGYTPLRLATKGQHIGAVKELVRSSVDIKDVTRDDWLALSDGDRKATVLEISMNSLGEKTLHFDYIADTPTLWDTTTDTCDLISFYNQEAFMSKLPPSLNSALVNHSGGAIVADVVQDDVAWFGASLDVPFTQDEPIAPKLTVSWHKNRVAWRMQNTMSKGQPAWETVGYASSLPCGWIPESASDFLAIFLLDVEQGWNLFLDHAHEYLAYQRSRQIDERGMSPALIDGLAKDAQIWTRLRTSHRIQADTLKKEYTTFCRNYRQVDHMEAMMRAIDDLSSKIADKLAKLDQTTRDLLQLEFAWVSIREAQLSTSLATSMKRLSWITFVFLPMTFASSLFGMNVDILENNPNWRWFLLFAGGALVMTFVIWLITKYFNIETLLERHLGKRLQQLSDPTARKSASSQFP